jgi:arsenical resistance protein ArsH
MTTATVGLPNIVADAFVTPEIEKLERNKLPHPPRILLLYGSPRERSYSRFLTLEAARLLESFGAQTRIFNPSGLPLPDDAPKDHPKCRSCAAWPNGRKDTCGARRSVTAR